MSRATMISVSVTMLALSMTCSAQAPSPVDPAWLAHQAHEAELRIKADEAAQWVDRALVCGNRC